MDAGLHWTRRFYRRHLARYGWARKLKGIVVQAWFWYLHVRHVMTWRVRTIFGRKAFYQTARAISKSTIFPLQPIAAYRQSFCPRVFTLASAESVELQMPQVYPARYRDRFHRQSWQTGIPAVEAVEVSEAEIMGRCEFMFTRGGAIHHDFYDFRVDLPGEEMHGLVSIETSKGLLARYAKGRADTDAEEAISILGWQIANYVHWLTEYLPRLVLVDEILELAHLPLAVDANLHTNILESLRLCNVHNRMFITLSPGEVLRLKRAVFITPTAYAPFDHRDAAKAKRTGVTPDRAMFVPRAVHALRDKLLSVLAEGGTAEGACRLYLRRNSHYRRMKNAEEVESLLRAHGFQVMEPERLSFLEQVRLFSTAQIIVAQAGAALGNMLFAPEGCRVIILSTWSPHSNYYYFSNLASILNQRCIYVLCDAGELEWGVHPAHRSPNVDIQLLEKVISHEAESAV